MPHEKFDPSRWLARWTDAGGGWVNATLLPLAGDPAALNALALELDDDRREALRLHLTAANTAEAME